MYNVLAHGKMISDSVRMNAHIQAIGRSIKPGTVVVDLVDLGTGTGIFALLACQFGAARVFAIEPDAVIGLARELAEDNGFADRIEFIQDISTNVVLPERADIIVSDLRGVLPLFQNHIPSIIDARDRFLKPTGVLIPRTDSLWLQLCEGPAEFARHVQPWRHNNHGLNLDRVKDFAVNVWQRNHGDAIGLLFNPKCWATLDYSNIEQPDVSGAVDGTATSPVTAHGLCVWFDAQIDEEAEFSNAPGSASTIYGSQFIPFADPIETRVKDSASFSDAY